MYFEKTAGFPDDFLWGSASAEMCIRDRDYTSYFEDTMRAGHYENNRESVDIMIRQSRPIIEELLRLGVRFEQNEDGSLRYAREGGHSRARICFHKDITGKEITTALQKHCLLYTSRCV